MKKEDFMNDLELIEYLEFIWPKLPKNEVWQEIYEDHVWIGFACQINNVSFIVRLGIGPRNGLSELILVFDSTKKYLVDHLLLAEHTYLDELKYVIDLSYLRSKIHQGFEPLSVCTEYMEQELQRLLKEPAEWSRWIFFKTPRSTSISTIRGGLPGLGKK